MKRFLYWRKMTWAILLGSAAMAVWVVSGGFTLTAIVLSLFGFIVLSVTWFLSRPLFQQGRGLRLHSAQSVSTPFKSAKRLASSTS